MLQATPVAVAARSSIRRYHGSKPNGAIDTAAREAIILKPDLDSVGVWTVT